MSALALPVPEINPGPARRRHLVAVPALAPVSPAIPLPQPVRGPVAPARPDPIVAPGRSGAARAASAPVGRPRVNQGRLRLTVRGQVVLSFLALVAAAAFGSLLGLALPADEAAPAEVATVTVGAGESLWVLAEQAASPGEDVRVVVDQIIALNALADSTVHAGQQLLVPAGE